MTNGYFSYVPLQTDKLQPLLIAESTGIVMPILRNRFTPPAIYEGNPVCGQFHGS